MNIHISLSTELIPLLPLLLPQPTADVSARTLLGQTDGMDSFRIQVYPNDGCFSGPSSRLLVVTRREQLAEVIERAREALALPPGEQYALRTTDGAPLTEAEHLMPNDRLVVSSPLLFLPASSFPFG